MTTPAPQGKAPTPPTTKGKVLIVDDDPIIVESLSDFLRAEGYGAATALNADEALAVLTSANAPTSSNTTTAVDVLICDIALPGMSGMDLLREVSKKHRACAVIMLTGYGTVESAVESLRLGACDYLTKPVVDQELRLSLERAFRHHALLSENHKLRTRVEGRLGLASIIGSDPRMIKTYDLVAAVAASRTTVLMSGESGTGKSLIAHAIHDHSARKDKPFVELSCGSIPETLLESELFGHVKGAFTGAHVDKAGRFLAANNGTIFLDEINSASPGMQLKLLRVLQERKFEPVGSTQTIEVDARVILASNQPLEQLVASGHFRQDLFYRINVVKIELPPLRDRIADIPSLAEHFLAKFAADLNRQIIGFSPDAMDALRRYHYPGNVRELQNIIERAAVLSRTPTIQLEDLPPMLLAPDPSKSGTLSTSTTRETASAADSTWVPMSLEAALRDPERRILIKALEANAWNRQRTAEQLNINRTTLYKKMKSHGLMNDERLAG